MLQSLHVKNLALIDEVEVEFSKGLNIMTGETGAGKSIILGSVHLALGGRYTADILRKGADFGFVELVFDISNEEQVQELKNMDIYPENGMIVLSRKLMEGRSISKINGETVTQTMLKNVASLLIDIHGQHEHQSLLNKKNHLIILDEYMGTDGQEYKKDTLEAYKKYRAKVMELEKADIDIESRSRELSFMQFELQEIQEANLKQGEDEELEGIYRKMGYSKKILEGVDKVYANTGTYGEYTASQNLNEGLRALQDIAGYDEFCQQLLEQLSEIDNLLSDFNREIVSYREEMEFSEQDFMEIEERLNIWNRMKGKYGKTYELISEYELDLEHNIQKLEDYDSYLVSLRNEVSQLEDTMSNAAIRLSESRKKSAQILELKIKEMLEELNFSNPEFRIQIDQQEHITADGMDNVGFLVALNEGEELKPLSNVVSGGELSRIMLAIKTVMADKDQIDTLIFDEVDAGISGITATKVGEKLALIGKSRQVICITHLAQIAALATEHFYIQKNVDAGKTKTEIHKLTYDESIEELTRILGGGQKTAAISESAKEMKEMVTKIK